MRPTKNTDKLDKRQKKFLKDKFGLKAYKDLNVTMLINLKESMKDLTDSRISKKCHYKVWDVVVCVIISILCGKKDWEEIHDFVNSKYDFFRSFLKMTGGVPNAITYKRIMSIIDYHELENILNIYFKKITIDIINRVELLNVDGRVNNGSKREETLKRDKVSPLNMINVYSNKNDICIASEIIESKTNEIPKMEEVLKRLNIEDAIITCDALNTQTNNVKAIVSGKGEYVLPIKGNHPLFYQELIDYFSEKQLEYIRAGKLNTAYKKVTEYKNGIAITYEYYQTEDIKWYEDREKWDNLHSFALIVKTMESKDKVEVEHRYYISSLFINIELIAKSIREHWHVENKLHWHLDYTFKLDKNNTLDKMALANFEIICKFCLGMLNRVKPYYGISLKRIMGILGSNIEEEFPTFLAYLALADGNKQSYF